MSVDTLQKAEDQVTVIRPKLAYRIAFAIASLMLLVITIIPTLVGLFVIHNLDHKNMIEILFFLGVMGGIILLVINSMTQKIELSNKTIARSTVFFSKRQLSLAEVSEAKYTLAVC